MDCIGDDMAQTNEPVDQGCGLRAVAALTRRADRPHWQPKRSDGSVALPSPQTRESLKSEHRYGSEGKKMSKHAMWRRKTKRAK